jgi:hypothetical protein
MLGTTAQKVQRDHGVTMGIFARLVVTIGVLQGDG